MTQFGKGTVIIQGPPGKQTAAHLEWAGSCSGIPLPLNLGPSIQSHVLPLSIQWCLDGRHTANKIPPCPEGLPTQW